MRYSGYIDTGQKQAKHLQNGDTITRKSVGPGLALNHFDDTIAGALPVVANA